MTSVIYFPTSNGHQYSTQQPGIIACPAIPNNLDVEPQQTGCLLKCIGEKSSAAGIPFVLIPRKYVHQADKVIFIKYIAIMVVLIRIPQRQQLTSRVVNTNLFSNQKLLNHGQNL